MIFFAKLYKEIFFGFLDANKDGVYTKSFKAITDNNENEVTKRDRTKDRTKKVKVQVNIDVFIHS